MNTLDLPILETDNDWQNVADLIFSRRFENGSRQFRIESINSEQMALLKQAGANAIAHESDIPGTGLQLDIEWNALERPPKQIEPKKGMTLVDKNDDMYFVHTTLPEHAVLIHNGQRKEWLGPGALGEMIEAVNRNGLKIWGEP